MFSGFIGYILLFIILFLVTGINTPTDVCNLQISKHLWIFLLFIILIHLGLRGYIGYILKVYLTNDFFIEAVEIQLCID